MCDHCPDHSEEKDSASATAAVPPPASTRTLKLNDALRSALESTTVAARVRAQANSARTRKNIRKMSEMEINILRNAYEELYRISDPNDERGYQWIAGRHGYPGNYCHRSSPDFYTWHRAYIYEFEERLRDAQVRASGVATVTLPYWDWTVVDPQKDDAYGIPKVCGEPTYVDLVTGETKPNPLFSAYSIATQRQTQRFPDRLALYVEQRKRQVEEALDDPDYLSSQSRINSGPHGNVHIQTGGSPAGDMYAVRNAAFDPIFWLHHANVDRIFWLWQRRHGNATVPQAQRDYVAVPWSYTGEQILQAAEFFRYTYRETDLFQPFAAVERPRFAAAAKARAAAPVLNVRLGELEPGFERARLRLHNLHKTEESYEVRVFFNQQDPTPKTPAEGNPSYAGTFYLFGHGECIGDEGHCAVPERRATDRRPVHHNTPENLTLDVTTAARAFAAPAGEKVDVSFLVLDAAGAPVPAEELAFDGISLETF